MTEGPRQAAFNLSRFYLRRSSEMSSGDLRAILALMEEAQQARQKALAAVKNAAAAKAAAQADLDATLKIHGYAYSRGPPAPPNLAELASALEQDAQELKSTQEKGPGASAAPEAQQGAAPGAQAPQPGAASLDSQSDPAPTPGAASVAEAMASGLGDCPYPSPPLAITVELALLEDRDIVIAPLTMPTGGKLPVRYSVAATAPEGGPPIDAAYLAEACSGDYIALCRADDPGHLDQFSIEYTDGQTEGEVLLQLPRLPGRYDARYVTPVDGGRVLARSGAVEVATFSEWSASLASSAAAAAATATPLPDLVVPSPRAAPGTPIAPSAGAPSPATPRPSFHGTSSPRSPESPELSAMRAAASRAAAEASAAASAFAASHLPPKPAHPRPKPPGQKPRASVALYSAPLGKVVGAGEEGDAVPDAPGAAADPVAVIAPAVAPIPPLHEGLEDQAASDVHERAAPAASFDGPLRPASSSPPSREGAVEGGPPNSSPSQEAPRSPDPSGPLRVSAAVALIESMIAGPGKPSSPEQQPPASSPGAAAARGGSAATSPQTPGQPQPQPPQPLAGGSPTATPQASMSPRFAATPQPWRVPMPSPDPSAAASPPRAPAPPEPVASFLLEKQVKISVYQLCVPLPPHCQPDPAVWPAHVRAAYLASGGGGPGAAGGGGVMHLPPAWRPGLAVSSGDDARGCAVEVVFELPDTTPGELLRVTPHLTPQERTFLATRLPRRAFALRLNLPDRVDPATASVQLYPDHMSVRLPLLHPGAALPDRELRAGGAGAAEVRALRATGRSLACNACRGSLLRGGRIGGEAGGAAAPPPPQLPPLRANLLPSEHWLEWSDLWICHGAEQNAFAAAGDFGAVRGSVLVAEQHLQLHPADVDPRAIVLRVPAAALLGRAEKRAAAEDEEDGVALPPIAAVVECARCLAPLGSCDVPAPCVVVARAEVAAPTFEGRTRSASVRLGLPTTMPPPPGRRQAAAATAAAAGDGADAEARVRDQKARARGWPDQLSLDAGPVVKLLKHRVNTPSAPSEASAPGGSAEAGPRPPQLLCVPSAFAGHSASSALAARLLSAALAHQRYRCAVVVEDATAEGGAPESAVELVEGSGGAPARPLPRGLCVALTLVNWNTSLRCAGAARASSSGGGSSGDWHDLAADTPVLKVRVLGAADGADAEAQSALLSAWAAEGDFDTVALPAAVAADVRATLASSAALVPPSVRVLGGMDVAYLPLPPM